MQIERLGADEFLAKEGLVYVDIRDLHGLYEKLAFKSNLILVGPKGEAKSLSVAAFCAKNGYPVITFDCSEDVRRAQLIGTFTLRGDSTPFILGPIPTAFEIANEKGCCVLILEEINSLSPQAQKVLNPATDWRRSVEVPEAKRVFRLQPKAELWIVGTMNGSVYGGVYSLNEDLKSRFRMVPIDYPKKDEERRVLTELLHQKQVVVEKGVLDKLLTLAQESRQGSVDYPLSTRDLVQICEDSALIGISKALWIASGKFEGADRVMMAKRIESTFGIPASVITGAK